MAHLHLEKTVIRDRRLPLPGRVVVIGRNVDVDVPLPHRSVSRQHALLEETDGGFFLSDLGSSNGTFVGSERLAEGERRPISLGTSFRLGEVVLRLAPDEVIEEEPELAPLPVAAAAPIAPTIAKPGPKRARRAAAKRGSRPRTPPARRAVKAKERQDAMKWLGVIVTLTLLTIAGLLLVKIVGLGGNGSPAGARVEKKDGTRGDDRFKELKPLSDPR